MMRFISFAQWIPMTLVTYYMASDDWSLYSIIVGLFAGLYASAMTMYFVIALVGLFTAPMDMLRGIDAPIRSPQHGASVMAWMIVIIVVGIVVEYLV